MSTRRIEPGMISGVGPALITTLAVHGIRSAADIAGINGTQFLRTGSVYWSTISGIGPAKSAAIQRWHQRQLMTAGNGVPQSLPAHQMHGLDNKYATQRRQQQAAIDAAGQQLQRVKATVEAKYDAMDREITQKVDAVRLDYKKKRSAGMELSLKPIWSCKS